MNYYYVSNPITCNDVTFTKVGITSNPPMRLRTYRTLNPYTDFLVVYGIECSNINILRFETYILNYFEKIRINTSECLKCIIDYTIEDIKKYIDSEIKKWFGNVNEYKNYEIPLMRINKKLDENEDELQTFKQSSAGQDIIKATQQQLRAQNNLKENNYRFHLREYQKDVICKLTEYFKHNNRGILNWACGLGKTLTTLYYMTEHNAQYKTQHILIGVPSIAILKQWVQSIKQVKLLSKYAIVCITDEYMDDPKVNLTTTTPHKIKNSYDAKKKIIYITTYHSSKLLTPYKFDFIILDEVHHLQSSKELNKEEDKEDMDKDVRVYNETYITGFKAILTIDTKKMLSLTATMKDSDESDIFGQIIDRKSVHWAIENKYITDYKVLVMESEQDVINAIVEESKIIETKTIYNADLFLSAFSTIYGMYHKINNMSHTFIYTNSRDHSNIVKEYIKIILNSSFINCKKKADICSCLACNLYFETVNSYVNDVDYIIDKFRRSKYGIIICVYMLGEGFDEPIIDSVCIGQNMISKIRSIQSLLRGNRLDKNNPNKVNTVILPNNKIKQDYYKQLLVLVENLRNEDVNIENRLTYMEIKKQDNKKDKVDDKGNGAIIHILHDSITNNIKFRLLNIKRMNFTMLYNEYSMYNKRFNFKCISDYKKIKNDPKYHVLYIDNPEEYFITIWNKSDKWYGFLGIDTSLYPKSKDEWLNKCRKLDIKSGATYLALCEKNNMPIDYDIYYGCSHGDTIWAFNDAEFNY